MKELIKFVFNPICVSELNDYTFKYKIKSVLTIFILTLLLIIGAATINILLMLLGIAESFAETGNNNLGNQQSLYWLILLKILIIPISEELSYRLYLRFKPINLAISLSILFYYLISGVSGEKIYEINSTFVYRILSSLIFGVIIYFIFNKRSIYEICMNFWRKYFKFILYFSVILFAFSHIGKYSFSLKNILLSPILLLPQIITGFTFGYSRMKFGIFWSFFLHSLINLFTAIPLFFN